MTRIRFAAIAALAACLIASTAPGAIILHGTYVGATVDFVDVTEDNNSTGAHYGSFSTINDVLLFDPVNFAAQDNDLTASDLLDSELDMMLMAHKDNGIETVKFSEAGDYTIITEGSVTASLPYFWEINEVDGTAITPITGMGVSNFADNTVGSDIWTLDFTVDYNAELLAYEAANGNVGNYVTKATIRFDNTLAADGTNGGSAFIKKKTINGMTVTAMVPEPASLATLLMGMLLFPLRRRR